MTHVLDKTPNLRQTPNKKQKAIIDKAANGVWYYQQYFLMALNEDKMAGKLMSKKGRKRNE